MAAGAFSTPFSTKRSGEKKGGRKLEEKYAKMLTSVKILFNRNLDSCCFAFVGICNFFFNLQNIF